MSGLQAVQAGADLGGDLCQFVDQVGLPVEAPFQCAALEGLVHINGQYLAATWRRA